jgi:transcriptional regulator with XRE-family HTH domain
MPSIDKAQQLREQTHLLEELAVSGWSQAALCRQLRLRRATVAAWFSAHPSLARPATRSEISELLGRLPPPPRSSPGRTPKTKALVALESTCGVDSPAKRVMRLGELLTCNDWTQTDLAERLGIAVESVGTYLNPNWPGRIAPPVLRRLKRLLDANPSPNRQARFRKAAEDVFGPYYAGLPKRSHDRVARLLAPMMGMSERHVHRILPPYSPGMIPSARAIDAIERTAKVLKRRRTSVFDLLQRD